ncbi:MoaD/ThiS family protein [Telluribacter sp.]|jgi:molybdopterin converting factor subunit 1|uniref:MoaD/ThiS family protein n=1 Tax=Telluribacter sp. TaxID=1978767 RepID=UPI002E1382A2|nr:MoaD/ThiS family protein [Telluribacter sp.]
MTLSILYFGMLAEATGHPSETWEVTDPLSVGQLREQLLQKYPSLRDRKFQLAVNQQVADPATPIDTNAEVALLPPFAGG